MKTRLSSPFTFIFKVVMPCLWLVITIFVIVRTLIELSGQEAFRALLFLAFWIGTSLGLCYRNSSFALKQVSLDDESLYVSNYLEQITVPLIMVDSVKAKGIFLRSWPLVIVRLKSTSELGSEIRFVPGFYYKEVEALLRSKTRLVTRAGN